MTNDKPLSMNKVLEWIKEYARHMGDDVYLFHISDIERDMNSGELDADYPHPGVDPKNIIPTEECAEVIERGGSPHEDF